MKRFEGKVALLSGAGINAAHQHEMAQPLRMPHRVGPRYERPERKADQHRRADPQLRQQRVELRGEIGDLHVSRERRRLAVPEQVVAHHAMAGARQARGMLVPHAMIQAHAVDQYNRRSRLTVLHIVSRHALRRMLKPVPLEPSNARSL